MTECVPRAGRRRHRHSAPMRRGHIEAMATHTRSRTNLPCHQGMATLKLNRRACAYSSPAFPCQSRHGPIEAFHCPCVAKLAGFPCPPRHGSIEDPKALSTCGRPSHSRAHQGTAPLKHGLCCEPGCRPDFPCPSRHGHIEAMPRARREHHSMTFHATQGTAPSKPGTRMRVVWVATSCAHQGTAPLKHGFPPCVAKLADFPCPSRHGHIEATSPNPAMTDSKFSRAHQGMATLKQFRNDRWRNRDFFFPCLPRHGHIEAMPI